MTNKKTQLCLPIFYFLRSDEQFFQERIMPKKSEIDPELFIEHLQKLDVDDLFIDKSALKPENDDIWKQIKQDLRYTQQAKSIQCYLRNDRHFSLSKLKEFFGIQTKTVQQFEPEHEVKKKRRVAKSKSLNKDSNQTKDEFTESSSEESDASSDDSGDDYLQTGQLKLKIRKFKSKSPDKTITESTKNDRNLKLNVKDMDTEDSAILDKQICSDDECEEYQYFRRAIIKYSVPIQENVWNAIKPTLKKNKRGWEYYKFSQGWCDIIYDVIWSSTQEHQRIPCVINFRSSYIYKTERKYAIKIMGYCKECDNKILIRSKQNPFNVDSVKQLIFEVKTYNSKELPHQQKRRVVGPERERILQKLINSLPSQWRNEKARLLIQNGVEPAHLYNLECLQKIKFQARIAHIGIKYFKNEFGSLQNLKHNSIEYGHIIKNIGFDKFYVFYLLPEQIDFYKDYAKYCVPLSIDASGSVVRKIKRPNGLSGHIFVYVIVTHIGNRIVPLCQMLSEQHDTGHIKYWLEWWQQQVKTRYVPREVVTDMAPALQNAVSLTFNRLTYNEFIKACFRFLQNETTILPLCWIRIDISHLIVAVTRWQCFKGKERRNFKDFYVRCVGYLSTLDDLKEISKVVNYVLLIASTKYDEQDPNVQIGRDYLLTIFQTSYDTATHSANQREVYKGKLTINSKMKLFPI